MSILSDDFLNNHDRISHANYAPNWDPIEQKGYSLTMFDDMEKAKKVIVNFDVEFSMTGPWEIELTKR